MNAARPLGFGFSPCPNDTFAFHALVAGTVAVPGVRIEAELADIEALNERAVAGRDPLPVTKLSLPALAAVLARYAVLDAGAALGRGCGPLVVCRAGAEIGLADLRGRRVAIPGRFTTANLLLRIFGPNGFEAVPMRFEQVMPAVAAGTVDAGLVIHESRFTYGGHGLEEVADLGVLWEGATGLPLPLGLICADRALGAGLLGRLEEGVRASVAAARARPGASAEYVRAHAQELDAEVRERHIALYVNDYSERLGAEGRAAVEELLARGRSAGFLPEGGAPWWREAPC